MRHIGLSIKEYEEMEIVELGDLAERYRKEKINNEIRELSIHGVDPMKIEFYRNFTDNEERKNTRPVENDFKNEKEKEFYKNTFGKLLKDIHGGRKNKNSS